MSEKRYDYIDEEEYGAYWIIDTKNCKKQLKDFPHKDYPDDLYDTFPYEEYILKHSTTLTSEQVIGLLNEQDSEITQLKEENQTLYCQLNNFKLCKWDLDEENKLLKQALRETLQDNGDAHLIKIMDKLFELEYNKWESERYYEDWEETLELKELRDLYEK